MKTTLIKSLAVLFTLLCAQIYASAGEPTIEILSVENKSVAFTLKDSNVSQVIVKDTEGEILYSDNVGQIDYSKKYDFNSLVDGGYELELHSETKFTKIAFEINSNGIAFGKESIIYKPILRQKDNSIIVNMLALNDENLEVSIIDDNLNIIYRDVLKGSKNLGVQLSLENLNKGLYQVKLKASQREYFKTVAVK